MLEVFHYTLGRLWYSQIFQQPCALLEVCAVGVLDTRWVANHVKEETNAKVGKLWFFGERGGSVVRKYFILCSTQIICVRLTKVTFFIPWYFIVVGLIVSVQAYYDNDDIREQEEAIHRLHERKQFQLDMHWIVVIVGAVIIFIFICIAVYSVCGRKYGLCSFFAGSFKVSLFIRVFPILVLKSGEFI